MSKKKAQQSAVPQIKCDYGVIILNAEDAILDPILQLYYNETLLQKRRAITAISMETITLTVMSEKENPEILKARPFIVEGQIPPINSIMLILNRRMEECLKENDRILEIQEINRKFDFLEYWQQTDSPSFEGAAVGKGKDKVKGKEKPTKTASKTGKQDVKLPPLEKVTLPEYVVKNWSALALRGQNSNQKVYIEDSPIEGPSIYVVIMGIYSKDVLFELVCANVPVIAVIKLVASNRDLLTNAPNGTYADYWTEMANIKAGNNYKHIAFYDVVTHVHPDSVLSSNVEQVSYELTCLVYDAEDRRRQHQHYQNNIKVFDVEEKGPCLKIEDYPVYSAYFDNLDVQQITIEYIVDAMLQQVDQLAEKPKPEPRLTRNSLASVRESAKSSLLIVNDLEFDHPLNCDFDGKIVIEQQDNLRKTMLDVEDRDFQQYRFRLKELIDRWMLNRFMEPVESMTEELLFSMRKYKLDYTGVDSTLNTLFAMGLFPIDLVATKSEVEVLHPSSEEVVPEPVKTPAEMLCSSLNSMILQGTDVKVDHYAEMLTPMALQQQLIECLQTYDSVVTTHLPMTASVLLTFSNNSNTAVAKNSEYCLTTRCCFRDYVDYVIDEQQAWIRTEEEKYESGRNNGQQAAEAGALTAGDVAGRNVCSEFMINRSLKKHGNEGYEGDQSPPTKAPVTSAQDTAPAAKEERKSRPSTKDRGRKKSINTIVAGKSGSGQFAIPPTEGSIPAALPFQGFNMDDRRHQLNSLDVIYRSSLLSIRYGFHEWLYRLKNMFVDVELHTRDRILFGKIFSNSGQPMENIDCVLIKRPDDSSIVVQVVPGVPNRPVPQNRWQEQVPKVCQDVTEPIANPREMVLRIAWPNGLMVKTIANRADFVVEQNRTKALRDEIRRVVFPNGLVAVYFLTGEMKVMSADGMVVETGAAEKWADAEEYYPLKEKDQKSNSSRSSSFQDRPKTLPSISPNVLHADVLASLRSTVPQMLGKYYKLITSDGSVFLVDAGSIVRTLTPLYMKEIHDYLLDECFVRREDNVKMMFRSDSVRCLHADGTEFWSNLILEDMPSFADFEFDPEDDIVTRIIIPDNSCSESLIDDEESIDLGNVDLPTYETSYDMASISSSAKKHNMIDSVVEKFVKYSADECFTYVERSFRVRHPDYEELVFHNESNANRLHFPGRKFWYTRNEVTAQLATGVDLQCDTNGLRLTLEQCAIHQKSTALNIAFSMDQPLILNCVDAFQRQFTIDRLGKHRLDDSLCLPFLWQTALACPACSFRQLAPVRNFIVKRQWNGYELWAASEVEKIVADCASSALIVNRENDTITVLNPVPVSSVHTAEISVGPDKFHSNVHNVACCQPSLTIDQMSRQKLPATILLRHFQRVPSGLDHLQELVAALSNPAALRRGQPSSAELQANKAVLCAAAIRALQEFLRNEELAYIERTQPPQKALSEKYIQKRAEVQNEFGRAHLYRRMMRTGFIPRFQVFQAAQYHVRNLDEEEMMAAMDEVELAVAEEEEANAEGGQDNNNEDKPEGDEKNETQLKRCYCSHIPCAC